MMLVNITQYKGQQEYSTTVILFLSQNSQTLYDIEMLYIIVMLFVFVTVVRSPRCSFYMTSRNTSTSMSVITVALLFNNLRFKYNLLLLCGNVELNPVPK